MKCSMLALILLVGLTACGSNGSANLDAGVGPGADLDAAEPDVSADAGVPGPDAGEITTVCGDGYVPPFSILGLEGGPSTLPDARLAYLVLFPHFEVEPDDVFRYVLNFSGPTPLRVADTAPGMGCIFPAFPGHYLLEIRYDGAALSSHELELEANSLASLVVLAGKSAEFRLAAVNPVDVTAPESGSWRWSFVHVAQDMVGSSMDIYSYTSIDDTNPSRVARNVAYGFSAMFESPKQQCIFDFRPAGATGSPYKKFVMGGDPGRNCRFQADSAVIVAAVLCAWWDDSCTTGEGSSGAVVYEH
jgi:hypothetical protein